MNNDNKIYEGFVSITKDIDAYVKVPDLDYDSVFVKHDYLNTAMQGDRVNVLIVGKDEGGYYGKIEKILNRYRKAHTGVLSILGENKYFLVCDDKKTYLKIIIDDKSLEETNSKIGDKVAVKILTIDKDIANANIIRNLGKPGENNAEMLAYAIERGFSDEHNEAVVSESKSIKERGIIAEDYEGRRDFRNTLTFTIDPLDAKDFDDAISYKVLDNGHYEVGVHIADVSYYVRPGSAIDDDSIERETSVYLVDRCVPMLPEVLSNDLCSLVEGQDRLVMSAVFELDNKGHIYNEWYGRSVIHSAKRFTYENAQESMDKNDKNLYGEELNLLNNIAKNLYEERLKNGALVLDSEEVKFVLDENGHPVDVYIKTRGDTHKMIEEYMLLANRKVSEFISKNQNTKDPVCIYRIHDKPDPEKMHDLDLFIRGLGEKVRFVDGNISSTDLNNLLKKFENRPEKELLQTNITRSMAKAIYSTDNVGHYGLGFEYYSHFTSPIRRYPDVLTHRLLQRVLDNDIPKVEEKIGLERMCIRASMREKEASDAERGSIKYKQVEYMGDRIGKVFSGVVSGVSKWGIYVEEKKSKCEGMIRLRDLGSDFYNFDEKSMRVIGERTGEEYKIGDQVKIEAVSTDLELKQINYMLIK